MDDLQHPVHFENGIRYLSDEQAAYMWGKGIITWTGDGEWVPKVSAKALDQAIAELHEYLECSPWKGP